MINYPRVPDSATGGGWPPAAGLCQAPADRRKSAGRFAGERIENRFDQQPRQSKREYVSGETLYLWGKQYFLLVEYGNKNDVDLRGDSVILTVRKGSAANQRGNVINEWYRKRLKEEITKILPKWEEKTGITATEWKVRYMTSRWGSCNVETGTIWLNLQLAKKTPECLEYIILHELVHLVEKNHNEAFLSLLDLHMPMWREIKAKLTDIRKKR